MKILLVLLVLLFPLGAHAATINASACTPAAVTTAIAAASAGDTVQLPTCTTTTWNAQVTVAKAVHIKGTGTTTTNLRKSVTAPFFRFDSGSPSSPLTDFSLCCMTLEGITHGIAPLFEQASNDHGVYLSNGVDFRVYDMTFQYMSIALSVFGNPQVQRGVIYNNTFFHNVRYSSTSGGYGVEVRGNSTYPTLELGTTQNVFIEDNYFEENRHGVESANGSRYVARYNTFVNHREDTTAIDAHGNTGAFGPSGRGSRQWEVYNNLITNAIVRFGGIGMRGGDGTIFNNVITNLGREVVLWNEDFGTGGGCDCTYPCADQTREAYIWNNTPSTIFFKGDPGSCHRDIIELDRDYFAIARPGYTLHETGLPNFPTGKTSVYPLSAVYPHPLREDPPIFPPNPPAIFHVTPIP